MGIDQATAYAKHKQRAQVRQRDQTRSGRDIGAPPECLNPLRRDACATNFRLFCETYFPLTFSKPWSDDHRKVISKIETAVIDGGLFAVAMPRGSGKTCLAERAALWAILYGHHPFAFIVGATESHAGEVLDTIKAELSDNDTLAEDFPAVCTPIRALEGIVHRTAGQLMAGERTRIVWTQREIVFPTWDGSPASGAIIRTAGITGRIRGQKYKRPDGTTVRPTLVIPDDPQTRESAESEPQCDQREAILAGDVLGLAGPGKKISGIMPLTVIHRGDVADNILDTQKHPEWNGERMRMIYAMPADEGLWAEYARRRGDSMRAGRGLTDATAFYVENRAAMDAGAVAAWIDRFNPDEMSAIQHAMDLKLQDAAAFAAEYQNEPIDMASEQDSTLAVAVLAKRCVPNIEWQVVPAWADILTCTIDVGLYVMHWEMTAWNLERDQSAVIEVQRLALASGDPTGRNRRDHTTLSKEVDPRRRAQLAALAIREGLADILRQTTTPDHYRNPDGSACAKIPLWGVDVGGNVKFNDGQSTEIPFPFQATVMEFCGSHGARWHPMKGVAPWSENKLVKAGRGHAYYSPDAGMWLTDTDYHKTKLYAAYQRPTLDADGGLVDGTRVFYSGLAEFDEGRYLKHQEAEEVDERGRWKPKKPKRPNHFWDCAYMSFALADITRCRMAQPLRRRIPAIGPVSHVGAEAG